MNEPSYYAIIPANVRYDKDLKPNAKLLYGEITALCNKEGYCWASNDYFAGLYSVSKETVSRWISQLAKKEYVFVEIQQIQLNDKKRKIFIQQPMTKKSIGIDEKIKGSCQKNQHPHDKNVKYNNTSINNTKNITTTKAVAVDPNILNLQSKIKDKTNLLIHEKSIIKLLESKTEDKIMYYADNWNKIVATSKGEVGGGLFIDAVIKEYSIPEKNATNVSQVDNMFNFEQRNYKKEDFEKYYYKVTE